MAKTHKTEDKVTNQNISNQVKTKEPIKINKLIIILIIVLIIAIILKIVIKPVPLKTTSEPIQEEKESYINDKKEVIESKNVDGLTFSDVTLVTQNNETYLSVKVTNNSNSDYKLEEVHMILKDNNNNNVISYSEEDGTIINYLSGYVGDTLKVGESRTLVANTDTNITNDVYTIDYEIIK